jgi:hypothetical protein
MHKGKLIIRGSQNISKFSHLIAYVGGKEKKKEELASTSQYSVILEVGENFCSIALK